MANSRKKVLQDRSAAVVKLMREMSDKLTAENRPAFTEDEEAKFQALKIESSEIEKSLKVELEIEEAEKKLATIQTGQTDPAKAALESNVAPSHPALKPNVIRNYSFRNIRQFPGETADQMHLRAYSLGQFFLSSIYGSKKATQWCQEHGIESLAQSEITNTAGGILVPDLLSGTIIQLMEMYGVYRRYAKIWPMGSDNLTIPRRLGGVTAYFVSDGVSTTESQKSWDGVTLVAKELAALVRYPMTLSDDAVINVADDLAFEIGYAMAKLEDQCGFIGDGSITYGGIRGLQTIIDDAQHGNSVTTNGTVNGGQVVAAAGGTSAGALVMGDFERMVGLLPQYASANACWFMSRAFYAASAQRLMDAAGGNTNQTLAVGGPGSLNTQDAFGRPLVMFLGYPVVIAQAMFATISGTSASQAGVAFLGDLSMAASLGTRKDISIMTSKDRYFEVRQIGIQGVERFDIVNHDLGTTSAPGPIVGLKLSAT